MISATLSDTKKTFVFPLPPETITQTFTGEYATNPVLDTTNPLISRKSSNSTTKLGRCLFISISLTLDMTSYINTLQTWAQNQTPLKFAYNKINLPVCYIKSMNVVIKQYFNGKPVHVEIDIDLLQGGTVATVAKVTMPKTITPREQQTKQKAILQKLKTPTKRAALGVAGNYDVQVSSNSVVTVTDDGVSTDYDYDTLAAQLG